MYYLRYMHMDIQIIKENVMEMLIVISKLRNKTKWGRRETFLLLLISQ